MCSLNVRPNGHWRLAPVLVAALASFRPERALAHEAWLLTPDEMAELAIAPIPPIFTDTWPLAGIAVVLAVLVLGVVIAAERLHETERRIFAPLAAMAATIGPIFLRVGLALMLGLGAVGGLPRHGTAIWTTPTLLVPDMQLTLAGDGFAWLAYAELIIALCLLVGLFVRAAAIGVMMLVLAGFVAFGTPFFAYGPHFLAPALILLVYGGGSLSPWPGGERALPELWQHLAWRTALALFGCTFVYLGIAYKLNQPTLLIAILDHGDVPTFGLSHDVAALIMMLIEVTAGALLALGLLVRPIALFLIGAFTFFAVTIGETPLFHANLYGAMAMLLLAGGDAPRRDLPVAFHSLRLRSILR